MESYILDTINVIISNLEKNGFVEIDEQQETEQETQQDSQQESLHQIKKYKLTVNSFFLNFRTLIHLIHFCFPSKIFFDSQKLIIFCNSFRSSERSCFNLT